MLSPWTSADGQGGNMLVDERMLRRGPLRASPFLFFFFFFLSAPFLRQPESHSVGVTGAGGSAGREAACGDNPFPAAVSEELMQLGLAVVAVGLARKGQLKE